jgi:hypothetical protein
MSPNQPTEPPETAKLANALIALGMRAAIAGRAVRAWAPANEERSVWVVPGWSAGGAASWSWQRGERSRSHPRSDVAGAADAVMQFLATLDEVEPENGPVL